MSEQPYKIPFRQNQPVIVLGVEATQLFGSIIVAIGPMLIFRMNMLGMALGIIYWVAYSRLRVNSGLPGGILHKIWRLGLWVDGKKYKYDPTQPDLYS